MITWRKTRPVCTKSKDSLTHLRAQLPTLSRSRSPVLNTLFVLTSSIPVTSKLRMDRAPPTRLTTPSLSSPFLVAMAALTPLWVSSQYSQLGRSSPSSSLRTFTWRGRRPCSARTCLSSYIWQHILVCLAETHESHVSLPLSFILFGNRRVHCCSKLSSRGDREVRFPHFSHI